MTRSSPSSALFYQVYRERPGCLQYKRASKPGKEPSDPGCVREGGMSANKAIITAAIITAVAAIIAALITAMVASGRPNRGQVSGGQPSSSAAVSTPPSVRGAPPTRTTTAPNGTVLGSYNFTLGQYRSAPLGPTAPTQSQILSGSGQDVIWNTGAGGAPLQTGSGDTMLILPSGATPTYRVCKADTITSDEESRDAGTAYCLREATGRMAGVTVASAHVSQSPWYLNLHVVIWKYSP